MRFFTDYYDAGRCAARNMLGLKAKYENVPFFYTSQYGKSLRMAGECCSERVDDDRNLAAVITYSIHCSHEIYFQALRLLCTHPKNSLLAACDCHTQATPECIYAYTHEPDDVVLHVTL